MSWPALDRRLFSQPRIQVSLVVVICLAAIAVWGGGFFRPGAAPQSAGPEARDSGNFRPTDDQWKGLRTATIRAHSFPEEEQAEGQITTADDVTVSIFSPFSGQVAKVLVQVGDAVRQGQPLALVKATELAQGRADLRAARASLASARAQLSSAEANATRQRALFAVQGASERDLQQADSDLAAARAAVTSGDSTLAAARSRLNILGFDNAQIDALARQTTPDQDAIATIASPISGMVVQRQVGPGQYINSTANGATTALFTISDVSKVWLVANLREEDAGLVHVGDPVQARLAALPGRLFNARISYVAPVVDPATHRLPVRAVMSSPNGMVKPGMFADFSIISAAGRAAPAVPVSAVVYDGAQARVWVIGPNRSLLLRPIKVGRSQNGLLEVLGGLAAGERVVTAGALFIDRAAKGE